MFTTFIAKVHSFFTAKVQPAIADAEAAFEQISPYATALLNVLHALGIIHDHVAAVAQDVIATASSTLSGPDKLAAVTAGVQKLAADGVLSAKSADEARTVAQVTYALVKEAGLLTPASV